MPNVIRCPACQKALRVREEIAGARVQCPACKHRFAMLAPDEPEEEEVGIQLEEERPARRSRSEPEDEDRPRRRPRLPEEEDEEEEEERPRRPRRRKRSLVREYSVSSAPLVYGIFAILLSCIPIAGIALGVAARNKADTELAGIPDGNRYRGSRQQMELAKILGTVGICLGILSLVAGIILRIKSM